MPSTYAAYYNVWTAQQNQKAAAASSRTSSTSNSTSSKKGKASRRFSLKSALDQLKPTEEVIRPQGIYAPIIRNGPLFHLEEPSKSNAPTGIYTPLIRNGPLFHHNK